MVWISSGELPRRVSQGVYIELAYSYAERGSLFANGALGQRDEEHSAERERFDWVCNWTVSLAYPWISCTRSDALASASPSAPLHIGVTRPSHHDETSMCHKDLGCWMHISIKTWAFQPWNATATPTFLSKHTNPPSSQPAIQNLTYPSNQHTYTHQNHQQPHQQPLFPPHAIPMSKPVPSHKDPAVAETNNLTTSPPPHHRPSVSRTEKSKWERLWPVIACGAGLFSDGYLNNVCNVHTCALLPALDITTSLPLSISIPRRRPRRSLSLSLSP